MTSFYGGGVVIVQGGGGSGGDGVGIANAIINSSGELVLYLTNGAVKNVGKVVGSDGMDGKDGVTFTPTINQDGILSWTNNGNLPNPPSINLLEGDIWNELNDSGSETPKPPDSAELDKTEWIEL